MSGKLDTVDYILEDCMETIIDYRGKTPIKTTSGIPLITAKIVKGGQILPYTEYISEEDYEGWMRRGIPKVGDVLITTEAPLGEVAQLNDAHIALAQRIILLRGKTGFLDNRYLKYLLQTETMRAQIEKKGSGTTVVGIKQRELRKIKLPLPSYDMQLSLSSILSAYDNLIENNLARISLLEKMASELYKEWFVRFRFPGHETAKFVNGLPEGWEYMPLKNIMTFSRGISYSTEELSESDGYNLINLKNISAYGGFNYDGTKKFTGKYKESQIVQQGDLVIGITDMTQDRRTVGSVALIPDLDGISVISADLLKVNSMIDNIFIYCLCKFGSYSKYFSMFANGANVLHLRPDMLYSRKILIPNIDIINEFVMHISPIFEEMTLCHKKNELLSKQRDLLLPRLMSGKLSVEPLLGQTA